MTCLSDRCTKYVLLGGTGSRARGAMAPGGASKAERASWRGAGVSGAPPRAEGRSIGDLDGSGSLGVVVSAGTWDGLACALGRRERQSKGREGSGGVVEAAQASRKGKEASRRAAGVSGASWRTARRSDGEFDGARLLGLAVGAGVGACVRLDGCRRGAGGRGGSMRPVWRREVRRNCRGLRGSRRPACYI